MLAFHTMHGSPGIGLALFALVVVVIVAAISSPK
jgi:hypothetical protein